MIAHLTRGERRNAAIIAAGMAIVGAAMVLAGQDDPLRVHGCIIAISCAGLMLSLLVAMLSLGTGRTTVLQGVVHLVIFAAYLFTTVVP